MRADRGRRQGAHRDQRHGHQKASHTRRGQTHGHLLRALCTALVVMVALPAQPHNRQDKHLTYAKSDQTNLNLLNFFNH
ncbi:hypothetical protein ABI_30490 [Asticcacaulis biprosthecium C19]|uniref:Uncharacterized protein n=1 Tax=Asticcacaulis biprosthecium C19 TaxID=715226 RepID=F4QN42_9CAUL|nr:hypothetical protein ABI_30490 [Asticcacaulis biprosthecium C19]